MTLHRIDDTRTLAAKQAANLRRAQRDWERTHPQDESTKHNVPRIRIAETIQVAEKEKA